MPPPLVVVVYFFREINGSFENLRVNERVAMPDDSEITVSYQYLLTLLTDGVEDYRPEDAKHTYNIRDLLGHIQPDRNDETELLEIARDIKRIVSEEDTPFEAANKLVDIKPNFAGIGFNFNELFKLIHDWLEKR